MSASDRVPDLAGLRLLVAVGRLGSIGAAARSVGVSQQSASERLRGIEAQTGLTLVRRTARGSDLTDAGLVVGEWAARLIELTEEIGVAVDGLRDEQARGLVVWASMTVADGLVPRWLVRLRQRQQRAGVEATAVSLTAGNSEQVEAAVRDGVAQLGFVEGVDAPRGLRSTAVADDELVLVAAAGDPLGRRRRALSASEVALLGQTGREPGSGTREVVERALAAHGHAVRHDVELTTATAVRASVLAGGAPAFLSRRVVARDLASGDLVEVPTELELRRVFRAVWAGGPRLPAGPARDLVAIASRGGE